MTTESTSSQTGGFAGDPFAALNQPTATTGCCSATETMTSSECCTTPATAAGESCCQPTATEQAGCC